MKKNIVPGIVVCLVVLVMALPIIINIVSSSTLKKIEYKDLEKTISDTGNYGFNLVYVAPSSNEDLKEDQKVVLETVRAYKSAVADEVLTAVYLDYDALSENEKNAIFKDSDDKIGYMFVTNNEVVKTVTGSVSRGDLSNLVSAYSGNGIAKNLQKYNVAEDAEAYSKLVKQKKKVTMAVFGRDTCFYCNHFKIVYNTVADEYGLDNIYYFDSTTYDQDEYNKIMDLGLKIPASCNSGKEIDLQPGFSTPLTLFTKNGKVIDCIDGYINKASLITKLEAVGILEAEKE